MLKPLQPIRFLGLGYWIKTANYANGREAYLVVNWWGDPFMKITVNLPGEPLQPGEFFVKTWGENREFIAESLALGLFVDTGRRVPTGHCEAAVWRHVE